VLEAWERRAEMSVGRGGARSGPEPDVARAIAGLETPLVDLARRRPDLAAPLEAASRSLERLGKSGKNVEDIETSLARLDKRLAQALADVLPAAERERLSRAVQVSLKRASAAMDAGAAERTARALMRRALREHLELPRLSLLP
jgi:ABC-type transporter Mla subunit MlaD